MPLAVLATIGAAPAASAMFTTFESGQVRPLAISGTQLYAVNTPDNRLEIFDIQGGSLSHSGSVPVGLEPVAVAVRSNGEVWVVNHLSDSISIVDVNADPPVVTRTLLVGDEPRDIVVANGTVGERVFITTARRGQNSANHSTFPVNPLLTTEGIGRALVWAFDPNNLGTSLEGNPLTILELFGDTPRALAVTPDGSTVYAAVFHSGNQTTIVSEGSVCDGGSGVGSCNILGTSYPGGLPAPNRNVINEAQPEVGLIVRLNPNTGNWEDELGRNWNNAVRFSLPDLDVFEIATAGPTAIEAIPSVGTINFNMEVNPNNGNLYVTNTEAINEVRFEGPGTISSTVNGHLHEARISVIDGGGTVTPIHLNKHINYGMVPSPAGTSANSLATPLGMAIDSSGTTVYLAAFGSAKVAVLGTNDLENDNLVPGAGHIALSGGGPTGLVLDEGNDRLYVMTRFDNSISVINTLTNTEVAHLPVYNPEPANVVDGRPVLYDANATSSNGEASCSSCHVFGDLDSLGWDLGNPDDPEHSNPIPATVTGGGFEDFASMKGPMTTQSLRGMANHGAMHWRGDRSNGFFGIDAFDEVLSFKNFTVAFPGLLGNDGMIPESELDKFASFILDVRYPPNPNRPLDNTLVGPAAAGPALYNTFGTDIVQSCNGCHTLNPGAGFFGTNGNQSFENETQHFKIPHLRNAYQKVGMFGMPAVPFIGSGNNAHTGDQVRGFGFLHDGAIDTIFRFLSATVFILGDPGKRQLEQFIFQFDTNLAPIVGQQTTLTNTNGGIVGPRIDLLIARASTAFNAMPGFNECDLIVKGTVAGTTASEARGWVMDGSTLLFESDRAAEPMLSDAQLRAIASTAGNDLTYTCAPPGSGERMGIDRDEDGFLDRDEIDAGTDPADPNSFPGGQTPTPTGPTPTFTPTPTPAGSSAALINGRKLLIKDPNEDESRRKIVIQSNDPFLGFPAPGSAADPRCNGDPSGTVKASLTVSSTTSGQIHRTDLPCQNWKMIGSIGNPTGYKYKDKELDDGTAKLVLWKAGKLKAVLSGKGPTTLDYDLTLGQSQGTVDAVLINDLMNLCLACPPDNGRNGSDGKKFQGKNCSAPASCGTL